MTKSWIRLSAVATISLSLFLVGCAKQNQSTVEEGVASTDSFEVNADSDSGNAGGLATVRFDFDSSTISSDARTVLDANADILKAASNIKIQVEGHCDERGGIQYNLALGERRAKAVKDYLVALGIESKRVKTVSFGKEKPIEYGHSEDAWAKNRRANFVITAK